MDTICLLIFAFCFAEMQLPASSLRPDGQPSGRTPYRSRMLPRASTSSARGDPGSPGIVTMLPAIG